MCYYRRVHFVSCGHQYFILDSVMQYCPSAVPFSQIQPYPANRVVPATLGGGRRNGGICLPRFKEPIEDDDHRASAPTVGEREDASKRKEIVTEEARSGLLAVTEEIPPDKNAATVGDEKCPPNTPPASSSSVSGRSNSSPNSPYSTPPTQCNGDCPVMTPGTRASSSPPTRARDNGSSTFSHVDRKSGMMPCNLFQSHPLTTYRLREICLSCRNARQKQDERIDLLKDGLKQMRISVEGIVAMKDIQSRDGQAHMKDDKTDTILMKEPRELDLKEIGSQDVSGEEGKGSPKTRSAMPKKG